jgi:hypothetical protein
VKYNIAKNSAGNLNESIGGHMQKSVYDRATIADRKKRLSSSLKLPENR